MKFIFIGLLVLLSSLIGKAQDIRPVEEKTALENIFARSSSFIQKDFLELGRVNNLNFQLMTTTDLISNKTLSGLRIFGVVAGSTYVKSTYLDADEIEGFLSALTYMNGNLNLTPLSNKEWIYTSKNGFKAGVVADQNSRLVFLQLDRSTIFNISAEELKKLEIIIKNIPEKIKFSVK